MSPRAAGGRSAVDNPSELIVTGHLRVDPAERTAYLEGCHAVVGQARSTPGCLDFALSADLVDPGRINVLERWESLAAVEAFRGDGVSGDQAAAILGASVAEYDAVRSRVLSE